MSYRGLTIPLPVGQQGFTGTENPSQAGPGNLLYTDGAELEAAVIKKEGGASKFNSAALGIDTNVKILLRFDGTDGSTTITDSAPFPRVWTAAGNAQLDTAQFKFGGSSLLLDGIGDYVTTPDSPDFSLGAGDWTVEFWFNCNVAGGTLEWICGQNDGIGTPSSVSVQMFRTTGNVISGQANVGSTAFTVTGTTQFTNVTNTGWHHCALSRQGSTLRLFIDGVQEGGNVTITGSINNSANVWGVGTTGEVTADTWTGWIDRFELIVGLAKRTANFTPPTSDEAIIGAGFGMPAGIVSGTSWSPAAGAYRDVVFLDGGVVLKDTGLATFPTIMAYALATNKDPPPWFTVAGGETVGSPRKLFMFSASNQVRVVIGDADTMAPISTPPADWANPNFPTFGVLHGNRLWGGGNASDPHRLYYSLVTNHQDFTTAGAGTLAVYPGEGERLVAAVSFRTALIVFKYPQGIYVVDTSDPTPTNWSVVPLTRAVGTLSQHTLIQIENDILYMDISGGIHALSVTQEFGDLTSSDIGDAEKIRSFMRKTANLARMRRAVGIWHPKKQQAWFAVPMLGSENNNLRFVTLIEPSVTNPESVPIRRFFMSRRDVCPAMWLRPDANLIPNPVIGDDSGFIWNMDTDVRSKDGLGYPITFESTNTDFGFFDPALATRYKSGQFLEIAFEPRGAWDLTTEVFWDDSLTDIINFSMGSGGATIGSFILDTDTLASSNVRSSRVKMEGSGRRLRLVCSNSGVGQDVSISAFYVHLTLGDERVSE
jgi:hypothetical protein